MQDHYEPRVVTHPALDDALDGDLVAPQHVGDPRQHPGAVGDLEVQVERRGDIGDHLEVARTWCTGASPARIETTSPSTALAVSTPPAPGPDIVISVIVGASTMTALNGPSTGASGWPAVEKAGENADADPSVATLGDPEQLQRQAELLRVREVVGLDLGDPL